MIRRLTPLFSLVLALGCGTPTELEAPFRLGEPFWLAAGEAAFSEEGTTMVRFERVIADSRCPGGDIVCIWEGEVTVDVSLATILAGEAHVELHQVLGPRAVSLAEQGRRVELLDFEDAAGALPGSRAHPRVRLLVTRVP